MALGNIIGSNIYNILGIGGATGLMAPGAVPGELVAFDNYVMIGVTPLLLFVACIGMTIAAGAAPCCWADTTSMSGGSGPWPDSRTAGGAVRQARRTGPARSGSG